MTCLLLAATATEILPFLDTLRNPDSILPDQQEIDVLITGVGLTGATYALSRQIQLKKPDLVIQAGIAGSFEKDHKPGTVVIVRDDRIGDESVVENGKLMTLKELGLRDDNEWLKNPHKDLLESSGLPLVRGISVNQITTDRKFMKWYREKFRAVTESMEGAALHVVCLSEGIPFIQLRGISNRVGERNRKKWKLKKAIRQLNKEIERLLLEIHKKQNTVV